MHNTFFYKKDGSPSSVRTTVGEGKSKTSFSQYFGSNDGGTTVKNGPFTSRFNKQGQCISFGITSGRHTTYVGKNGNLTDHITAFR